MTKFKEFMSNSLSKKETLLSGIVIYFVGNVLTQLLSLVMLKFITGSIPTDGYGYFNLIVTIDNLVTPIITLQISDAVFKFMIRSRSYEEKRTYYTIGTTIIFAGALIVCGIVFCTSSIISIEYPVLVSVYVISTNVFSYTQRVIRSLGKNKHYVVSNIIKSVLYIVLQLVFVIEFNLGVRGLFLANIISTFVCIIILDISTKTFRLFDISSFNIGTLKTMVSFSAPLIPNTAIWWFQSSCNSLIITSFISLGANGIYSIANKFSSLLAMIISVFSLAWQESAIKEYGNDGYEEFATDAFNSYVILLFSSIVVIVPTLKLFMPKLIDESYYEAIPYVPVLLFSTALSAFSGFFAQIITAKGNTKKLMTTNMIGAITNILIVLILIKPIGLWSVVIGSAITNICLASTRYREVRDVIDIKKVSIAKVLTILMLSIVAFLIYYFGSTIINIGFLCLVLPMFYYINKIFICDFIQLIFKTKRKK